MRPVAKLLLLLGFGTGCAEPAFSPLARDNELEDIKRTLAQGQVPERSGRSLAYLVGAERNRLAAVDLASAQSLWEVDAEIRSRLAVGRGFIAHRQGGDSIAVRDASNGAVRCVIKLRGGEQFLGLAADDRVYVVTRTATGANRRSAVVAASADGCVEQWRDEATGSMGAPAARGGIVAVPYLYQNVVFLDGRTGKELARVRATDESITFVRSDRLGFVYGGNSGVYLFDPKSAAGSKSGSSFVSAKVGSSQIRTFYYYDAYQTAQADYTAFDRNRLLWRAAPTPEGSPGFVDGALFLHSYRYFFGFDALSGDIRWAYVHPRVDVVGSDNTGPAVLFASAEGELGALDAKTGALVWSKKTGLRLAGVTFDAEGFAPGGKSEPAPVARTLAGIVRDPDARFSAVKIFAIDAMTRVPGQDTTAELVATIQKEGVAPAVTNKAGEALVARRDGDSVALYREALSQHYDYLADRRVRGVDVLARVAVAVNDPQSVDLLAAHLLDPATPLGALKEIVTALVSLGGPGAVRPLRDFVLTYRCDTAFLADPQSLQWAADGLRKLGGPEERRLVTFLAEEPRTLPVLATYIRRGDLPKPAPAQAPAKPKLKPGEDRPDLPAP